MKQILVITILLSVCWSCNDNVEQRAVIEESKEIDVQKEVEDLKENNDSIAYEDPTPFEPINDIADTKWKLYLIYEGRGPSVSISYVDIHPNECEECFTLIVDSNYVATMYGKVDTFTISLLRENHSNNTKECFANSEINETDGKEKIIFDILHHELNYASYRINYSESYGNDLWFSSNYKDNIIRHVIFKPFDERSSCEQINQNTFLPLAGTKWEYVGLAYNEMGNIKAPVRPDGCDECLTMTFITDDTVRLQMISSSYTLNITDLQIISKYRNGFYDGAEILYAETYKDGEHYFAGFDLLDNLYRIRSFTATNDELKIYLRPYKSAFLLFKR